MSSGVVLTMGVIAGAAVGVCTLLEMGPAAATSVAAAALALLAERRLAAALGLTALVTGAAAYGALARDRAQRVPLAAWLEAGLPAGRQTDRARAIQLVEGRLLSDAALAEGGVRLLLHVERVNDAGTWIAAAGRVQAHVAGQLAADQVEAWTAGRRIRAPLSLRAPALYLNFGGASPRLQALRRPFDLLGGIKSAALVEVAPGAWWHEAAAAVRAHVRRAIAAHVAPYNSTAAAIVTAILIGDRAGLDDAVERRLQAAGTYHVIAISGGNVALLTALCAIVLRLMVRSARAGTVITIALVLAYGWIVGNDPSVRRAVTAATLYLTLSLAGLVPRGARVLSTAGLALVLADPLTVIDVGAWLSFGATLGILLFAMPIASALGDAVTPRNARPAPGAHTTRSGAARGRTLRGHAGRVALLMLAASAAAELVIVPISAGIFSRVSVAGLVLNFAAIPAMAVVQVAGIATVILAVVWSSGADAAAAAASLAAGALVGSSRLVEVVPFLSWRTPPVPAAWTIGYYLLLAAATWSLAPRLLRIGARIGALACLLIIVTAPAVGQAWPAAGRLRLAMLDVGQGDSLFVQFPSGQALLVDTGGGAGSFDIGDRIVGPALWALGARRVDWLAITHGDLDHVGGAVTLAGAFAPREIWEAVPVPPNPDLAALHDSLRPWVTVRRAVQRGHSVQVGEVTLEALHPPPPEWERQRVRNDDSLVLRVRYGDVEMLLTGDAGIEFERSLPGEIGTAPVRILKVGHHGSRTSTGPALVRTYRPHIALVSAGRNNLFGHPAPDVIGRLRAAGAAIFRTDIDGAVIVETDGRSVLARSATGRTWSVTGSAGGS